MNTNKILKLLIITTLFSIAFIILNSCDYQPSGVNFTQVDSTYVPADITLVLPDTSKDTIMVQTQKINDKYYNTLRFKILVDQGRVNYVRFVLDGVQIGSGTGTDGSVNFWFTEDQLNKVHSIELIASTKSGTGSVADKTMQEGYRISHKWYFIPQMDIYNSVAKYIPNFAVHFSREKTGLRLYWDSTNFKYFNTIRLYKKVQTEPDQMLYDAKVNGNLEFTDQNYVGEKAVYYMLFTIQNVSYNSVNTVVNKDLPEPATEKVNDKTVTIRWDKSKYPSGFEKYYLANDKNLKFSPILIDDINKTEVNIDNLIFGETTNVSLYVLPKQWNQSLLGDTGYYQSRIISNGAPSVRFFGKALISGNYLLTKLDGTSLDYYLYDINSTLFKTSTNFSSMSLQSKFSVTGKNVIFKNASKYYFESFDGKFNNLQNIDVNLITSLDYGLYSNKMKGLAISDKSTIVINLGTNLLIYSYSLKETIAKLTINKEPDDLEISSDGNYIYAQSGSDLSCYVFQNNSLKFLKNFSGVLSYSVPSDGGNVIYSDGSRIINYNPFANKEKVIFYDTGKIINIDNDNGLVLLYDLGLGKLKIYDLVNNNYIGSPISAVNSNYFIKGDYVYSETGFKIKFR